MIMPYGVKDTGAKTGEGPPKVNFDVLWHKALEPLIRDDLGYDPVRADQDIGALIIQEMLERLYFADLVIADLSIPNGNVYYEVGIRHASQRQGCVLIASDWARPLFDAAQMRRAAYPLPEEEITDEIAGKIRAALHIPISSLVAGDSPMVQALGGFPPSVDATRATSLKKVLEEMVSFQAQIAALRDEPQTERASKARELAARNPPREMKFASAAVEVVLALRDYADWRDVVAYIDGLAPNLRELPAMQEQRALACSQEGDHQQAIAALKALVQLKGATPERCGLLGGRYKRLYQAAATAGDRASYLKQAIDWYERGMMLDLNEYYCASNLPRLYQTRGKPGDVDSAGNVQALLVLACERAKARNAADEWLRPTLLGAAFDVGNLEKASQLTDEVIEEGAQRWKLASTIADLRVSVSQLHDPDKKLGFGQLLARLEALLEPS
jgi:hypothetical protein